MDLLCWRKCQSLLDSGGYALIFQPGQDQPYYMYGKPVKVVARPLAPTLVPRQAPSPITESFGAVRA